MLTTKHRLERLRLNAMLKKIILISQYHEPANDDVHVQEILDCLTENLLSPLVRKVFLLQENDSYNEKLLGLANSHKLVIVLTHKRLTVGAAFDFANSNVVEAEMAKVGGRLVTAIINNDNYVDNSAFHLDTLFNPLPVTNTIMFVSRTQTAVANPKVANSDNNVNQCKNFGGSADMWAFVPPFNYRQTSASFDFYLGTYMLEELIAAEISKYMPAWKMANPCNHVILHHCHAYRKEAESRSDEFYSRMSIYSHRYATHSCIVFNLLVQIIT